MHRTPSLRRAAMLAREGTSCGAYSWCKPWRERKATLSGGGEVREAEVLDVDSGLVGARRGWERIVIGLEGGPHGVVREGCVSGSWAMGVKWGSEVRPVPPIIAIWTGPETYFEGG